MGNVEVLVVTTYQLTQLVLLFGGVAFLTRGRARF